MIEEFEKNHWYKYDWDRPVAWNAQHQGKKLWDGKGVCRCIDSIKLFECKDPKTDEPCFSHSANFEGIPGGMMHYAPVNLKRFVDVTPRPGQQYQFRGNIVLILAVGTEMVTIKDLGKFYISTLLRDGYLLEDVRVPVAPTQPKTEQEFLFHFSKIGLMTGTISEYMSTECCRTFKASVIITGSERDPIKIIAPSGRPYTISDDTIKAVVLGRAPEDTVFSELLKNQRSYHSQWEKAEERKVFSEIDEYEAEKRRLMEGSWIEPDADWLNPGLPVAKRLSASANNFLVQALNAPCPLIADFNAREGKISTPSDRASRRESILGKITTD